MIENIKVRFARKPYDLADVLAIAHEELGDLANRIEIESRQTLTEAEYDSFAAELLADRDWLAGRGGYLDGGGRSVVEVTAPNRTTLYVDPSGSNYGRYVGLRVD